MSVSDSHTREQLRQTYADAWRKHLAHSPLSPLEAMISDVIGVHPEYQALVSDAQAAIAFEPSAGRDTENPFLHMGLHLAVRDQVSIDRPPGVRELHRQLQSKHGDLHRAEHALMEALGQTLWDAQRAGRPPDEGQYLARVRRHLETLGGP
jgi:Domain of unknown function (DUF1841)